MTTSRILERSLSRAKSSEGQCFCNFPKADHDECEQPYIGRHSSQSMARRQSGLLHVWLVNSEGKGDGEDSESA